VAGRHTVLLHIDYNSGESICQQAVGQIKLLVVNGSLAQGEKLPSIRQLAKQLQINPTTVTRIYNQLAHEGVVTLRHGQGVFVAERAPRLAPAEMKRALSKHARTMLVEGLRQGFSIDDIRAIVDKEYKQIEKDTP
jgi:GntR family transcriptional regulator